METVGAKLVAAAAADLTDLDQKFQAHAVAALEAWRRLHGQMMFDYSDNADIRSVSATPIGVTGYGGAESNTASLGYPDWWLRLVEFSQGPPPPPAELQCPPKCPSTLG